MKYDYRKDKLTKIEQDVLSLFQKEKLIVLRKEEVLKVFNLNKRKIDYIMRVLVDSDKLEFIKTLGDARRNAYFLKGNRQYLTIEHIRR